MKGQTQIQFAQACALFYSLSLSRFFLSFFSSSSSSLTVICVHATLQLRLEIKYFVIRTFRACENYRTHTLNYLSPPKIGFEVAFGGWMSSLSGKRSKINLKFSISYKNKRLFNNCFSGSLRTCLNYFWWQTPHPFSSAFTFSASLNHSIIWNSLKLKYANERASHNTGLVHSLLFHHWSCILAVSGRPFQFSFFLSFVCYFIKLSVLQAK